MQVYLTSKVNSEAYSVRGTLLLGNEILSPIAGLRPHWWSSTPVRTGRQGHGTSLGRNFVKDGERKDARMQAEEGTEEE